ncbi:MAG TPA: biotin/lipoyl-binding protein, partial [Hydrogenothermaceae bacterium]|nr:biotin/lipoyl-binding protein [Hydrogenothermaceae bacterium]
PEPVDAVEPAEIGDGNVLGAAAPVEFDVVYHGDKYKVKIEGVSINDDNEPRKYYVRVDGKLEEIQLTPYKEAIVSGQGGTTTTTVGGEGLPKASEPGDVVAPMPGKVAKILVEEGQEVKQGQTVAMVEAMKMENEIHAPISGVVEKIFAKVGDQVNPDEVILRIKEK